MSARGGEPTRLLEGSFTNVLVWDGACLVSAPARARLVGVTETVVVEADETLGMVTEARPVTLDELWAGRSPRIVAHRQPDGCVPVRGRWMIGRWRPPRAIADTLRRGLHERESRFAGDLGERRRAWILSTASM